MFTAGMQCHSVTDRDWQMTADVIAKHYNTAGDKGYAA